MLNCFTTDKATSIPIHVVAKSEYDEFLKHQPELTQAWLKASGFNPDAGSSSCVPDASGAIIAVICGAGDNKTLWSVGALPMTLPTGVYHFENVTDNAQLYAISWGLGAYQFTKYKQPRRLAASLCIPESISESVDNIVRSVYLVRDLINTPTDDMGPSELADVAAKLAEEFAADFSELVGDALLTQHFNAIHTVGRACDDAPRLLDIRWGDTKRPKLTLVGKGVCFDTGGLDLKPSSGMLLMKKDMGGAAHVLGLARMIMAARLPVCLRVLVPAVENSVSGNAYRPGDIIRMKSGLTVEIGNTDAEGRLVLADAITEAATEEPDLIIDMATLTGAARIALGTDLPALFTNDDAVAEGMLESCQVTSDPAWRMPLYDPYLESMNSPIADINNTSADSYGGAITAALFMKKFVPDHTSWVHFDLMAWNLRPRPGRPQGGEAMALRAVFHYLQRRYCK